MDRISHLPESIVHHILSFCNVPRYLLRMSVLSKNWFYLTASFPYLEFKNYSFRSRKSFFKYVEYATSRFCHHNLTTHEFTLIAYIREDAELDIVNRCVELVLNKGVRKLQIHRLPDSLEYRLPSILLSGSLLESLNIFNCELPSSLMIDVIKFKSLVHLELAHVHINDEAIKYLTASCPILQEFVISNCRGFKRIFMYGHQNLQKVTICYNFPLEKIDIEAPNLSNLSIIDFCERGAPQMNLVSCKNLTRVTYSGHLSPKPNGYSDFLSNFPFVEHLVLVTKYMGYNLKLSSHSLRTLVLQSDCDLKDINFNTPNLVLFSKYCFLWPRILDIYRPLVRFSTYLKASMKCYPGSCINALWFENLRLFLDKKNGLKVLNLYIDTTYIEKTTSLEKLQAIELPPYELEHVQLGLDTTKESSDLQAFVVAVLWCCRPRSLTICSPHSDHEVQSDLVKFTYERLLQQENQGHTNIQIVSPSSSSLVSLCPNGKAITFLKEEGTSS